MKLTLEDMPIIAEAIMDIKNDDMLRLLFACKALRKILSTGLEGTIRSVLIHYSDLCKRLVSLLQRFS